MSTLHLKLKNTHTRKQILDKDVHTNPKQSIIKTTTTTTQLCCYAHGHNAQFYNSHVCIVSHYDQTNFKTVNLN